MDDYLSDKEQVQVIKNWWKENGAFVIAGLVLGIGGLAGWNYWKSYTQSRAEAAGAVYQTLVAAADRGDPDQATAELRTLESDYEATPYLNMGRLMMARMLVQEGDFQGAARQLEDVVASAGDPELERVARVRLAHVLIETGDSNRALEVLDLSRAGAFAPQFHEGRGDVLVGLGDVQGAVEEYEQALAGGVEGAIDTRAVRLKIEALGVAAPAEDQQGPLDDA